MKSASCCIRFVSGGSQNEIYELTRGDFHGVIRIPPTAAPADRDKGIIREWRIIEALDGTGELLPKFRPDPLVASFLRDPDDPVFQRDAIPVPKGPVDTW